MMKAMILAAGRGERLRPLTDRIPKPLVEVAGKPLIDYQIERLVLAGFTDLVINTAYLGHTIHAHVGDGGRYGANVEYSTESSALETAGGIIKALPLLGERFVVVNADIWTDFDYRRLQQRRVDKAHLVLVPNPSHKVEGDFGIAPDSDDEGFLVASAQSSYTFSGIGLYHRSIFSEMAVEKTPLGPILRSYCGSKQICAEIYRGHWIDVGTIERVKQAECTALTGRA